MSSIGAVGHNKEEQDHDRATWLTAAARGLWRSLRWNAGLSCAVVLLFVLDGTAWAIPSPDLVVNLFASTAQVLGLLSVVLGSWFFSGGRRSRTNKKSSGAWRIAFFSCAGLCAFTTLGWILFASHEADLRSRRLQVNLERSSKEDGKKVGDVSLKELPFSEQQKRTDGIQTTDLAAWLASDKKIPIFDVRESEEYEMGKIPGARQVRFPDMMKAPSQYLQKNKLALLLCYNGNRSSEMCGSLEELGYDVRFMIGGYEKWLAEDRPLAMAEHRTGKELREVPEYPNKDTLLDTPDVMDLLEKGEVLFVDVRYPGEFEGLGHLPGAVNVPARKLTTPELEDALNGLPRKPVIIACYDKRSSFYAKVIGLRLSRLGFEFLGRYTTPEGFFVPGKDKPHVAAWKAAHEEKSLLTVIAVPLRSSLAWLQDHLGSLALAILAIVVALRAVVLPLTLKADRDRLAQNELEPEIAALKSRFKDDPQALSRMTMKLMRARRIRPLASFIGTAAQILLFTVFFSVVGDAAKASSEPLLWLKSLSEPDPWFALPACVAALLWAQLALTAKKKSRARTIVTALAAMLLFALVMGLRSGVNLYLVANLTLLVMQTVLIQRWYASRSGAEREPLARKYAGEAVIPLEHAHLAGGCGNKAARLGDLMSADLPVPNGFVVTTHAIETWRATGRWHESDRKSIQRAHTRLDARFVAVRSSGLNEDGADKSYAGVFESMLDVDAVGLFEALESVARSLGSARARAYSDGESEAGSILVQKMVPAEYAGVLFTEHPMESGAAVVELVAGLGDELVSGRVDPETFPIGRFSGQTIGDEKPPIDLAPLFQLGRRVERHYGRPQDIEWAFSGGRFWLLQARDITRLARQGEDARSIRERERGRLLELMRCGLGDEAALRSRSGEVVLAQNELSELLPEPTPFSLSWMDALWANGGSTDLACRALSIPYDVDPDSPPFVVGAFGKLYVNRIEEKRRLSKGPGWLASFRLSRAGEEIERAWREDYLPQYTSEARLREALDLTRLTQKELLGLFKESTHRILTDSYLQAETINIAADFYFKAAVRELEKRGLDPAPQLGHLPQTVVSEGMDLLAAVGRGDTEISAFTKSFGHRAPQDYELAQPRYAENEEVALAMAARSSNIARRVHELPALPKNKVLELAVARARRYQALKEEAKHHALHEFAFLRALLLEIGSRLGVGDGIFQLTLEEVARLDEPLFRQREAAELILKRQEEAESVIDVRLPGEISIAGLETFDTEYSSDVVVPRKGVAILRGKRVAGSGDVAGRVRVLRRSDEIDAFEEGEVLVARFTDPTWTPVFPLARGIITEVGGWLSHAAIQAREYDIPCIVGAAGALDTVQTGDLVCLHADGSVECFDERRFETRVLVSISVTVNRERETLHAQLGDVSTRGAMLLVPGHKLELGEDVRLVYEGVQEPLQATVIRNGTPGVYGLRFQAAVDVLAACA